MSVYFQNLKPNPMMIYFSSLLSIMNRAARYIGLYRPWGFKHNVFNLFYTRHPMMHLKKQSQIYGKAEEEAFFEMAEMMGVSGPKSISIYSQQAYPNYQKLHID